MLTHQQEKLLQFINNFQLKSNVTPSFDEMKDGLGLRSKSGIHRLLSALEERGYSESEIEKLWGGNLLRVLDEVQAIAEQIQSEDL